MIGEALRWQLEGRPPPLVARRGARARRSGSSRDRWVGELLAAIEEEAFAGELQGADEALAFAARRIASGSSGR